MAIHRVVLPLAAIILVLLAYFSSPWYWIAEAKYWEAVRQSPAEQRAIAWVITNRKQSARPEWSNTIRGVILDGAERGNNRDFTYRHKARASWTPEWAPIVPLAHAWRNGFIDEWLLINVRTAWFLTGYYTGWTEDPTYGALFYKVAGHSEGWFNRQIESGRFCLTGQVDAHEFYSFCLPDMAVELRGSPAAVSRAYDYAVNSGFRFAETGEEVHAATSSLQFGGRRLVELFESDHLTLRQVSYPFLLPDVALYVNRLAAQYHNTCGEPLVVTSASRPRAEQPLNSVTRSVHPAGMAVDLSVYRNACSGWLRNALLLGERRGYVDVTEEKNPPHFHVVVFPHEYRRWLDQRQ